METYKLPPRLNLNAAKPLADALRSRRGAPLVMDASEVTHMGTPGLQVLLSARKTWEADDQPLEIANLCSGVADQLRAMGLAPEDLAAVSTPDAASQTPAEFEGATDGREDA